jgi:hypothetical protein
MKIAFSISQKLTAVFVGISPHEFPIQVSHNGMAVADIPLSPEQILHLMMRRAVFSWPVLGRQKRR